MNATVAHARLHFLPAIPSDSEIPHGHVVVHNNVRPARRQGTRGFRYWLGHPGDAIQTCDCPWAPELGGHYRVTTK